MSNPSFKAWAALLSFLAIPNCTPEKRMMQKNSRTRHHVIMSHSDSVIPKDRNALRLRIMSGAVGSALNIVLFEVTLKDEKLPPLINSR